MLGAIIGDIAGSYYEVLEVNERKNGHRSYEDRVMILDENVSLFGEKSSATDDSILTTAIADAIINGNCDYEKYLKRYGLREVNNGVDEYGRSRFGSGFVSWLEGKTQGESFGNGAAMRIGPVGYLFDSLYEVKRQARFATKPSHDHVEAIKGAEAVATVIFLLRNGHSKEDTYKYVVDNYYELDYDLDDLQHNNVFSSKSSVTVPQALFVFFASCGFEDSIRKAISIGGDTDTIACIVGSISEAYYGVDEKLKDEVFKYLPEYMKNIVNQFYGRIEFKTFMERTGMNDEAFLKYIWPRTKVVPGNVGDEWCGCFSKVDDNGILTDIRLLVPEIDSFNNLLINIHEYTHAFELFHELGSSYVEKREEREASALARETQYIKKSKNKFLKNDNR